MSKLHVPPDSSKTDTHTLTDASLSLETTQEVLDERTCALQQQLNCSSLATQG